ncbi:hypothetical protein MYMA111404_04465 [Mycoplasma marinum]
MGIISDFGSFAPAVVIPTLISTEPWLFNFESILRVDPTIPERSIPNSFLRDAISCIFLTISASVPFGLENGLASLIIFCNFW